MGQRASRPRPEHDPDPSSSSSSTTSPVQDDTLDPSISRTNGQSQDFSDAYPTRKRRLFKRPSILSSRSSRTLSSEALPPPEPSTTRLSRNRSERRMTWRRWMNSPREEEHGDSSTGPELDGRTLPASSGKGKARDADVVAEDGSSSSNPLPAEDSAPNAPAQSSASASDTPQPPALEEEEIATPLAISPSSLLPPPPQTEPSAPPPPDRNFPPAGTLVVVQGVVHTTDVAPTTTSTSPAPVENRSRRASSVPVNAHGLSSLLSRPTSQRSSVVPLETSDSSQSSSNDDSSSPESSDTAETEHAYMHEESSSPRLPTLSPTSIDVLGTLLSVATAATAASLVSGSSDPLFSSGLALPGATSSLQQPSESSSRPLSPTPTAGLGVAVPSSSRERMRSAWGSIRDRFGLNNHRSPSHSPSPSPLSSQASPSISNSDSAPDPRTQLLAEMARAFHLGMGLDGGDGTGEGSTTVAGGTDAVPTLEIRLGDSNDASRPLPPEDSFERFLLDLQVDLRRILGVPAVASSGQGQDQEQEQEDEDEETVDGFLPWPIDVEEIAEDIDVPALPAEHVRDELAEVADFVTEHVDDEREVYFLADGPTTQFEQLEGSSSTPVPAPVSLANNVGDEDEGGTMPELEDASDSSSDEDEDDDEEDADGAPSEETMTISPSSPGVDTNPNPGTGSRTAFGSERRPGGGLNWWRMYRFPPMTVPPGQTAPTGPANSPAIPAALAASGFLPQGIPTPVPPTPPSSTATSSSSNTSSTTPTSTPPAEGDGPAPTTQEGESNVIVPVILVGLQSVNANPAFEPRTHRREGSGDSLSDQQEQQEREPDADERGQGADGRPSTPWRARAANAFRGLRPGHGHGRGRGENGESAGEGAGVAGEERGEGTGSTTFFIYVIGGYYPPNHSFVTGADSLDSFEAMWELAEMLGQAKPPTATKEDIARAGLEVIGPAELEGYEREGKVAGMCVDRCLICLEDWDEEDELRLMACRHLFHRGCVDKWLETGRNNCPACRAQGVARSADAPAETTAAAA